MAHQGIQVDKKQLELAVATNLKKYDTRDKVVALGEELFKKDARFTMYALERLQKTQSQKGNYQQVAIPVVAGGYAIGILALAWLGAQTSSQAQREQERQASSKAQEEPKQKDSLLNFLFPMYQYSLYQDRNRDQPTGYPAEPNQGTSTIYPSHDDSIDKDGRYITPPHQEERHKPGQGRPLEKDPTVGNTVLPIPKPPAPLLYYKKAGQGSNNQGRERPHAPDPDKRYYSAPKTLPAFPDAQIDKSKSKVQGGESLRKRWVDNEGRIYEWDSRHGTVEIYSKNGKKHLGEYDPISGKMLKEGDQNRKTLK